MIVFVLFSLLAYVIYGEVDQVSQEPISMNDESYTSINSTEYFLSFLTIKCVGFSEDLNVVELSHHLNSIGARDEIHLTEIGYEELTLIPILKGYDRYLFINCICEHLENLVTTHFLITRQEQEAEAFMRGGEYVPPPNPYIRSEDTGKLCHESGWSEQKRMDTLRLQRRRHVNLDFLLQASDIGEGESPVSSMYDTEGIDGIDGIDGVDGIDRIAELQKKFDERILQEKEIEELELKLQQQRLEEFQKQEREKEMREMHMLNMEREKKRIEEMLALERRIKEEERQARKKVVEEEGRMWNEEEENLRWKKEMTSREKVMAELRLKRQMEAKAEAERGKEREKEGEIKVDKAQEMEGESKRDNDNDKLHERLEHDEL